MVDLDKVALVAADNQAKEVLEDNLAKAVDQEADKADKNSKEPWKGWVHQNMKTNDEFEISTLTSEVEHYGIKKIKEVEKKFRQKGVSPPK